MDAIKIRVIRFVFNFLLYMSIMIATIYYLYTNQEGFFKLKNYLVPMKGVLFLAILFGIIFSGINEIITSILVRIARRKKQ